MPRFLKKKSLLLISVALSTIYLNGYAANQPDLPCGAEAVMNYLASKNGYASAEVMFNTDLFANADGACKAQKIQIGADCSQKLYTYTGFINASKNFPSFACTGNLEDRVRDLSGFFANVAQETYGGDGKHYNQDGGLYWRVEQNGNPQPQYDPSPNVFFTNNVYTSTEFCMTSGSGAYSTGVYTFDASTKPLKYNAIWQSACPSKLNTPMVEALGSGNWIGHGAIQLTGDSIFYGTAEYNAYTNKNLSVKDFANGLINNDEITWFSALYYWNEPKANQALQNPPEYYMISSNQNWGFGNSIYYVNGGCNNAEQRLAFFEFFNGILTKNAPEAKDQESQAQKTCITPT
ncbi:hypothetical protein L3V86_08740 [Thiotrichales bacterium 19S11-10]|nr:hypothetical protein [Thiotrichales bacterium 19S11-10]